MDYKITGEDMPVLQIQLKQGESIYSESGGMSWMSPNIQMQTNALGLGKAVSRLLVGESLFVNRFSSASGTGLISFSSCSPGKILPM